MLYKKAKCSWKTQEASFIVLSSFQVSSVTKQECLKPRPVAGAGLPGALQGTFQGSGAAGKRQTAGFCVPEKERASSGISIVTPLVFGKLVLLASAFISVFLTWLLVVGFMPC